MKINVQRNPKALTQGFNETTWDNWRGNTEVTLLASALRSATTNTPDQTNYNARGVLLTLNITARTVGASPSIRIDIHTKDLVSGSYQTYAVTTSFDPITGRHLLVVCPGAQAAAVGAFNGNVRGILGAPIPRIWRASIVEVADVTDLTYSLAAAHIL